MNSILVALFSVLIFMGSGPNLNNGEGGDLNWVSYTDGVKQASAENKKILVDVYTDWCGWCKKMESDTYSDENIKEYLTEKYILVKLNAESDARETVHDGEATDAQLAHAFGVNGYPTTVFLGPDGTFITKATGYMKPAEFLQALKYVGDDYYTKMGFQEYLNSQVEGSAQ
ncbi:MAG: thioredoxin fold domain-containing protein [Candidatus Kryptoniota bacterium]